VFCLTQLNVLYKRLADRLLATKPEMRNIFTDADGFRAGLVRFSDEKLTGGQLCEFLAREETESIFGRLSKHFSALGETRRWPIIKDFIVPALRELAADQKAVEESLVAPRGSTRAPRLGLTVIESLFGGCFGQYNLSAIDHGVADPCGQGANANGAPWLHWASRHMVSAQLKRHESSLVSELTQQACSKKSWNQEDVRIEFTLVSPIVKIEPVGKTDGPIVIELELAASTLWEQCKLVFYEAGAEEGYGFWRLARHARHARLDEQLSSQSADSSGRCGTDGDCFKRDEAGIVCGRFEAARAGIWGAVSVSVYNASNTLESGWMRPKMQIEVCALASADRSSVHFLFGVRSSGELEKARRDMEHDGLVPMTIGGQWQQSLLVFCDESRIDVKLCVEGGGQPERTGWCIWQSTDVPMVVLSLPGLAGRAEVTLAPTPAEDAPTGPHLLEFGAAGIAATAAAITASTAPGAAALPPSFASDCRPTTKQLVVVCSPTVAQRREIIHDARQTAGLMPNATVLDQTERKDGAAALSRILKDAQLPVDVLFISAHGGSHMGKVSIAFVDSRADLQTVEPPRKLKDGLSLQLILLNGSCSSDLAERVMASRFRDLCCVIGWSTVVNSRAASAFSYLLFTKLYAPGGERLATPSGYDCREAFLHAVEALQADNLERPEHRAPGGCRWVIGDPTNHGVRGRARENLRQLAGSPMMCVCNADGDARRGKFDILRVDHDHPLARW
jgi:hypothetical protein